ncbi:MAG: type II secretion system protein [Candidatus Gracilibacteria bacterium]|nr:type II secretion system protein [Candidatus Gracilibacteria bacterium]
MKTKKAFTLVELLVVITIIGIISTIGIINFFGYVGDANDTKRITDIQSIKISLDNYKRNHSLLYPINNSGSGITNIMTGTEILAYESQFDDNLAGQVLLTKTPLDPQTKLPYLYSVSKDRTSYQITATLENKNNLVSYSPIILKTYAGDDSVLVAYVEGNFIPQNKNILPGLLYAVNTLVTPNFDISNSVNLSKVILNGQSYNLAYDMNGITQANGTNLSTILTDVQVVQQGQNTQISNKNISCSGVLNTSRIYYNGENDMLALTGTTLNSQIGWKYKTCDGNTGNMVPAGDFYYNCANIGLGAVFDNTCKWTGCSSGYTQKTDGNPGCKLNLSAPRLVTPVNGASNSPISGVFSWYPVSGTNVNYKLYLGKAGETLTQTGGLITNTSYNYNNLAYSTTYNWYIEACEGTSTTCVQSTVYIFSTINDSTVAVINDPAVKNCENGSVVCTANDVVISYVGTSGTPTDGKDGDFGVSTRITDSFFGGEKILQYKIQNNSDGRAKFKVYLSKAGDTLAERKHANSGFDDSDPLSAIDLGGEAIANNLIWKYGNGCIYNSITGGYEVVGKTTCFITFNARADSSISETSSVVGKFKIINIDSLSTWTSTAYTTDTNLKLKSSGFNSPILTLSNILQSKQAAEPSSDTTTDNFGSSTITSSGANTGFWKSLTYRITNSSTQNSFFKLGFSGLNTTYVGALGNSENYSFSSVVLDNSTGNEDDPNTFSGSKTLDLQSNGVGNVIWKNNNCQNTPIGTNIGKGFIVPKNSNCDIVVYYRGDKLQPFHNKNIFSITLLNQTIADKTYTYDKTIKANSVGWLNNCIFDGNNKFSGSCYFADNNIKQFTCSAKPSTSVWNNVSGFTQTLISGVRKPLDSTTTYNTTSDYQSCRYKCNNGYGYYNGNCILSPSTSPGSPCTAPIVTYLTAIGGSYAFYNGSTSYTPAYTWNGTTWIAPATTINNPVATPTQNTCERTATCPSGYTWNYAIGKCEKTVFSESIYIGSDVHGIGVAWYKCPTNNYVTSFSATHFNGSSWYQNYNYGVGISSYIGNTRSALVGSSACTTQYNYYYNPASYNPAVFNNTNISIDGMQIAGGTYANNCYTDWWGSLRGGELMTSASPGGKKYYYYNTWWPGISSADNVTYRVAGGAPSGYNPRGWTITMKCALK